MESVPTQVHRQTIVPDGCVAATREWLDRAVAWSSTPRRSGPAEGDQQDDGGWTSDWLARSPGRSIEWRGILTLEALATLAAHGRVD